MHTVAQKLALLTAIVTVIGGVTASLYYRQVWILPLTVFVMRGTEMLLHIETEMTLIYSSEELGKRVARWIFILTVLAAVIGIFDTTTAGIVCFVMIFLVSCKLAQTLAIYIKKYDQIYDFHKVFSEE